MVKAKGDRIKCRRQGWEGQGLAREPWVGGEWRQLYLSNDFLKIKKCI